MLLLYRLDYLLNYWILNFKNLIFKYYFIYNLYTNYIDELET
jgi:hypothetical protein